MAVLGWLLIVVASGVPVFLFWAAFGGPEWCGGMVAACLVITHLFLIVGEMVTHRELPTRGRAMVICWGSFVALWAVGGVVSFF